MFCKECGEKNRNDRKFCANCGAPLTDYTKPRENLIMPDEIEAKQDKVADLKRTSKTLYIWMFALMSICIGLLVSIIFTHGLLRQILLIITAIFLLAFAIVAIANSRLNKKRHNTNNIRTKK